MSKGQSAIEYLTTYGWMLLVVAIVGGAIFTTVQNQDLQRTTGFTGDNVGINNFETTGTGELAVSITGKAQDPVQIKGIQLKNPETGETTKITSTQLPSEQVALGETTQVNIPGVNNSNQQKQLTAQINYSTTELDNLQTTGTITAPIQINNNDGSGGPTGAFYQTSENIIKCPGVNEGNTFD